MPIWVQCFHLQLMRYIYSIAHVQGKNLCMADTLSRAPVTNPDEWDAALEQTVDAFVNTVVAALPATLTRLEEIQTEQSRDETLQKVKQYCQEVWPDSSMLKGQLKTYQTWLLLRGPWLVFPPTLSQDILSKFHSGHQGIHKCLERAKHSVWWPGIREDINTTVEKCLICCKHHVQHAEPLSFPERPWQQVGTDLFEWRKVNYILVVDYYSRYIKVAKLAATTSSDVILHLKPILLVTVSRK